MRAATTRRRRRPRLTAAARHDRAFGDPSLLDALERRVGEVAGWSVSGPPREPGIVADHQRAVGQRAQPRRPPPPRSRGSRGARGSSGSRSPRTAPRRSQRRRARAHGGGRKQASSASGGTSCATCARNSAGSQTRSENTSTAHEREHRDHAHRRVARAAIAARSRSSDDAGDDVRREGERERDEHERIAFPRASSRIFQAASGPRVQTAGVVVVRERLVPHPVEAPWQRGCERTTPTGHRCRERGVTARGATAGAVPGRRRRRRVPTSP